MNWRILGAALVALPLIVMFAFVGWYKTTASLAELATHGAWTVHLPELLGRLVGITEMAAALALCGLAHPATRHLARIAAWTLIANQVIAAAFHLAHGEAGALPQNLVLSLLALAVALLLPRVRPARA